MTFYISVKPKHSRSSLVFTLQSSPPSCSLWCSMRLLYVVFEFLTWVILHHDRGHASVPGVARRASFPPPWSSSEASCVLPSEPPLPTHLSGGSPWATASLPSPSCPAPPSTCRPPAVSEPPSICWGRRRTTDASWAPAEGEKPKSASN